MTQREAQLEAKVQEQAQELARLRQENALLRQKVDLLSRKIFGCSSEKLSPRQLQLLLELAVEEAKAEEPVELQLVMVLPRPRQERKARLPEHLPVVEEVIDPEPVKAQPEAWRCIGQEVSEQLDYEPARFLRRRLIRRTFVHRTDKDLAPITAPLPPCLLERGLAAPGLLAQVVVAKYADHLPLYRQEQIFKQRHGVELSRQTLAGWIDLVADWLQPIYGHLRRGVFSCGYVQIDETPVRYLAPGHGKTKQGYFWTANRPGGEVIYHWEISRAARCLETVVPVDFKGTVQCDGYSGYDTFAQQRQGDVTLADCWAHVRRKFFDAKESAPRTAGWMLRQIQHLYRIEAPLRDKRCSPKLREVIRAQESRPIVERIGKACVRLKQGNRHLPQSPLGLAVNYTLNQWKGLQIFLTEGRVSKRSVSQDWAYANALSPKDFDAQISSTVNRFHSFLHNEKLRLMFGQSGASLDLGKALEEGSIIIVNLSTEGARVSEEDAALFATLLLSDLWTAAKERGKGTDANHVKPFYVYVDEFQNFITPTIAKNLDQARGFGLHLTLANQFPRQILHAGANGAQVYDSVMANARSKIVFETRGVDNLEPLAMDLFMGTMNPDEIKHELYSTKVMDYVDDTHIVRSRNESWSDAVGEFTGLTGTESESGMIRTGVKEDPSAWNTSGAQSSGTSQMQVQGGGRSESEVPFLRPVMGKELSSVQFRPLNDQVFKAMAALHDQKQRHAVARLSGMRAPVTIVTPTIQKTPATPKMLHSFLTRSYEKLPFALPSAQAHKAIADREQKLVDGILQTTVEPTTSKRRIIPNQSV